MNDIASVHVRTRSEVQTGPISLAVGAARYVPIEDAASVLGVTRAVVLDRVAKGLLGSAHVVRPEGAVLLVDVGQHLADSAQREVAPSSTEPPASPVNAGSDRAVDLPDAAAPVVQDAAIRALAVRADGGPVDRVARPGPLALTDRVFDVLRDYALVVLAIFLIILGVVVARIGL